MSRYMRIVGDSIIGTIGTKLLTEWHMDVDPGFLKWGKRYRVGFLKPKCTASSGR